MLKRKYYGIAFWRASQYVFHFALSIVKSTLCESQISWCLGRARLLYGLLLDRMELSTKNGWMDDAGRVYIIFTTEEIMTSLYCADNKATKLMKKLEGCGLIERKRRGLGKPNRIYVKNFVLDSSELQNKKIQEQLK